MNIDKQPGRQRGAATLLFILLVALALMAISAGALRAVSGSQKLQYAEHTATQAEMSAWAGVAIVSSAVAGLPANAQLTPNAALTLTGTQPGISVVYVGKQDGFLVFRITGSSAGAKAILQAAYRPPAAGGGAGGSVALPGGQILHGDTRLTGSVRYSGQGTASLAVLGGNLTMSGSVTGLDSVCATGDVTIGAAITVNTVCSNGNVTLQGAARVTTINAIGNVLLSGGGSGTLGTINSNGTVTLSGGSATANLINASGDVNFSGGSASAATVNTEGNILWTSSATANVLNANGTVLYSTSANPAATAITAIGDVTLSSAKTVLTAGKTTLNGYYGQGITGSLKGQGLLNGASWGAYGGAVVAAGTVGSVATPFPSTVRVQVVPGYSVPIAALTVAPVPPFAAASLTVDAYALQSSANFVFTNVDASGNPIVKVSRVNGVPDGTYFIANSAAGLSNYLCATVSGNTCTGTVLAKVCQGFSNYNACFSYGNGGWTIQGATMLPAVLWFQGNLNVGTGTWVNTFIASGNITTAGSVTIYAPNYPSSAYTCTGAADNGHSLNSLNSYGLSGGNYPSQLCSGSPLALNSADIGNIALVAGGYSAGTFSGGNISLGSSNSIYGTVLAGQYLNTTDNTTVTGTMYSGAQGGGGAGNSQSGSTTINDSTGSSAFKPSVPCMVGCGAQGSGGNVVWVGPV